MAKYAEKLLGDSKIPSEDSQDKNLEEVSEDWLAKNGWT